MAPTLYTPLPSDTFSIRLIRLQPSDDLSAPIRCKIGVYPLLNHRSNSYECLSYVWGSQEHPKIIHINTAEAVFDVTVAQNLHAALVQLRDPFFERVLWIDAICINQQDDKEKAHQVTAMARIYGLANRVVVWLGEEADQSALAFQKLSDWAQKQQPYNSSGVRHAQHEDVDAPNTLNNKMNGDDSEKAVHALLKRAYFRRMWILQEIIAARNILFTCGKAELQTATFVAGLDALTRLDEWALQNRIRAFAFLIDRSAFRESLKGQAHLKIDPLSELVDRFHTHDATDPRDKIYALWGLSSDHALMSSLQPDYEKPWKQLMEELGSFVFGDIGPRSASHHSQMLCVRPTGYILGKVEEVMCMKIWQNNQDIKITSMKAYIFLDHNEHGSGWATRIRLRAPANQILEGDFVLFLPHARRLIIARPLKYYLRVVTMIDSRLAQTEVSRPGFEDDWDSCQYFLDRINSPMSEFPLLWSWEKSHEVEEREAIFLMRTHVRDRPTSSGAEADATDAPVLAKAGALSDMAKFFMECDEYEQASHLLVDMVDISSRAYGVESGATIAGRDRLAVALNRKSKYEKAKDLIIKRSKSARNANIPDDSEGNGNKISYWDQLAQVTLSRKQVFLRSLIS